MIPFHHTRSVDTVHNSREFQRQAGKGWKVARGVFFDIGGVLYDAGLKVPGAVSAVERTYGEGLPVRYLTNSTRNPKRRIVGKLKAMGFPVSAAEVLTPAEAACDWLRIEGLAPHLLVHPDLEEDFGDVPGGDRYAVVVGDAGPCFTFDRMNAAFRTLSEGAPFLALADNRFFRDTDGELSLDAGAFVRALEYSSGTKAKLLGKPSPRFFEAGARSMGCALGDITMIGDDAECDIAGALKAGVGTGILVRTGKYRTGDEERFEPNPTAVVADIQEAVGLILAAGS